VNGYDHFSAETCRIFDPEEVARWNNMYQVRATTLSQDEWYYARPKTACTGASILIR